MTVCPHLFVSLFDVDLHKNLMHFFPQMIPNCETFSAEKSSSKGKRETGGS